MNKLSLLNKIPAYFKNSSYLYKISQLINHSSVRYSALFINQKNQNYLLLKEGNIFLREDWEAFSLLRASAKLIVSSGEILRKQPLAYKSRQGYGNQVIEDLNQALLGKQKQKLFFFTKTFTADKIKSYLNESYYDLVQLPQYQSVYNAIQMLRKQQNMPITIEMGTQTLKQYFQQVKLGKKTQIDTLLISKFSVENVDKYKGSKFTVPIDKYYNIQWTSEKIQCKLNTGEQGTLIFQVYTSKK